MPGERHGGTGGDGGGRGGKAGDLRIGAGGNVGAGVEGRELNYIEIGGGRAVEQVKIAVVPAIIGGTGDVHGRTVVGEDEAVFFHGVEDDLIGGRVARDVEGGFEAKARAHGKSVGIAGSGGPVGSGRNKTGAGILQRETDRMLDGRRGNFVIADKAGEDGESGGVGAGPGVRALLIGEKIPDGAGISIPTGGLRLGTVKLVKEAVGFVENEDVAVAGAGVGIALDGIAKCDGHGARVAFAAIGLVIDGDEGLGGVDNRVGDAHVGAVVLSLAEIGMQANGRANVIDEGGGVGINGRGRDVLVPEII